MSPTIIQNETTKVRFFLKEVCYVQMSLNTFPFVANITVNQNDEHRSA